MTSALGTHIRSLRQCRGLSLGDLARLVGYGNISKGGNRLHQLETTGRGHPDLLGKVAEALEIDWQTVEDLVEEDRRAAYADWSRWANEVIQPYLVVRVMAAVYCRQVLPAEIATQEAAEQHAAAIAAERHMQVCLVWSRRLSVWFDAGGKKTGVTEAVPEEVNEPYMRLKGSRRFLL